MATYPTLRLRRLRQFSWIRHLVEETTLTPHDLVLPIFIREPHQPEAVPSMPGVKRWTLDALESYLHLIVDAHIPAVALFPMIDDALKTPDGKEAINPNNLVCRAIQKIKSVTPNLGVICDVALDPYTSHGHDGVLVQGNVHNDQTISVLCEQALVQAQAGADVLAPSDMMDGRIGAIRQTLDDNGFDHCILLSYAVKYASAFYGPFREAIQTRLTILSDKKTYQMNPANSREALREVALDIKEGADMIMVKPGLPYLDIIKQISTEYSVPVFAYQVSGEYAMIKAASEKGWVDGHQIMVESLLSMKRAGACGIFTYAALEIAQSLLTKKE